MRIGLDIHGVIDIYPVIFKDLSDQWIKDGHEIHIITGQEWDKVKSKVDRVGISYTHYFSIVDYHRAIGTKMWQDEKKTWWMNETTWLMSKGHYISRNHIELHFDDSYKYARYIPDFCTFVIVPPKNFRFGLALNQPQQNP